MKANKKSPAVILKGKNSMIRNRELSQGQEKLVKFMKKHHGEGHITLREYGKLVLGVKDKTQQAPTALNTLKSLVKRGLVVRKKVNHKPSYFLANA